MVKIVGKFRVVLLLVIIGLFFYMGLLLVLGLRLRLLLFFFFGSEVFGSWSFFVKIR